MSRTTIQLLGAPRIERDGEAVEVDTRKATALVAYLAVTGRRHTRDALAGLLWPEYGQSRARAALRRTLSSLSGARSEGWLEVDRESVGLDREGVWVDVDRFHELLAECRTHGHREDEVCPECLPPLSQAAALYRDDFLAGFGLRDSAAFDDWQFFQGEDLRRELAGMLERLSRGHAALGEWEPAVSHARRRLALDQLHEPAHRWLMRLYAWAGERAAALRQYRECVRVLEGELGVSPLEETTRDHDAIKENNLPPPPVLSREHSPDTRTEGQEAPSRGGGAAPVHDEPLVGREAEWESLLRAYEAAGAGGRLVVLEGEAGVGKTRLAEEFLAHVAGRGATVVAARCYPGETSLAYGPFSEALSASVGNERLAGRLEGLPEHLLGEVTRLVPGLSHRRPGLPSPAPLETPGAQSRFFEGVHEALLALCGGPPPGVLFIDDVHWADASSLELLAYAVRRLGQAEAQSGTCVLLTWRGEELPAGHRLRGMLAEAQRANRATLTNLARLDRAAVEELVAAVVGEPDGLGGRLYDETEGLPLFLGEYLAAISEGELTVADESWTMPGGVRDLLDGRLAAVGETGRQLLGTAAVIGRSFDFDTAREASGRGEDETVSALEELVARGLVGEIGDSGGGTLAYDFGHEKLRALVYEELSLARRRLLHRRVAETLARRARRRHETSPTASAAQIARHYQLAGRDEEAADYFKLAGEHARALYANVEALAHFQAALALGHPDVSGLHEAMGDLHTLLGEYSAALASYEAADAFGDGEPSAAIEHKLGKVYQRLGEWDLAEGHLETALSTREGAAAESSRLLADLSLVARQNGLADLALERARRALALAENAGEERSLAQAHNVLGILASGTGEPEVARRHLEHSLKLADSLGDPEARVAALNNLALAHRDAGEIEKALERTEEALALCASLGDRHREAALRNNLADLLHAAGRSEEARRHLEEALTIFAEVGEEGELRPEIWKLVEW